MTQGIGRGTIQWSTGAESEGLDSKLAVRRRGESNASGNCGDMLMSPISAGRPAHHASKNEVSRWSAELYWRTYHLMHTCDAKPQAGGRCGRGMGRKALNKGPALAHPAISSGTGRTGVDRTRQDKTSTQNKNDIPVPWFAKISVQE